eukprot:5020074-Amphidinium_carterae.1
MYCVIVLCILFGLRGAAPAKQVQTLRHAYLKKCSTCFLQKRTVDNNVKQIRRSKLSSALKSDIAFAHNQRPAMMTLIANYIQFVLQAATAH